MLASEPSPHEAPEEEVGQAVPVLPRQASVAEVDHTCLRLVQVNELLFVYLGLIYGMYGTDFIWRFDDFGRVIPPMIKCRASVAASLMRPVSSLSVFYFLGLLIATPLYFYSRCKPRFSPQPKLCNREGWLTSALQSHVSCAAIHHCHTDWYYSSPLYPMLYRVYGPHTQAGMHWTLCTVNLRIPYPDHHAHILALHA